MQKLRAFCWKKAGVSPLFPFFFTDLSPEKGSVQVFQKETGDNRPKVFNFGSKYNDYLITISDTHFLLLFATVCHLWLLKIVHQIAGYKEAMNTAFVYALF